MAVIGAGPVGPAAVAHLIERGIEPLLPEAGNTVAAHLRDYGHVRLFSPWRYGIDMAMAAQLEATGWQVPDPDGMPVALASIDQIVCAIGQAWHQRRRCSPALRDRGLWCPGSPARAPRPFSRTPPVAAEHGLGAASRSAQRHRGVGLRRGAWSGSGSEPALDCSQGRQEPQRV